MLYKALSSVLFRLDAERSHELALAALRPLPAGLAALAFGPRPAPLPIRIMGLDFPNPVGLAAGLDKDGQCIDAFAAMGFGFIEVGTVTPRPQPGNPRPRLFRLPRERAIINRLGFNNLGVDTLVANVRKASYSGILGINIGKNFDTPNNRALEDYAICLRAVYPLADYVTVNISSPNTKGLRDLQSSAALSILLRGLGRVRRELAQQHGRRVPLVVKIAPDLERNAVDRLGRVLVDNGVDGVIATNTTVNRAGTEGAAFASETGGLSGAPLMGPSTAVLELLATAVDGALPIIGVGGILNGEDARRKREAGATLMQLYTGLIYRGPALVRECVEALRQP